MKGLEERHRRLHQELEAVRVEVAYYCLSGTLIIESNIEEVYQHSYACDQFVNTHGVEECVAIARRWLIHTPVDEMTITSSNRDLTARAIIMISLYAEKAAPNAIVQLAETMTYNLKYGFVPRLYVRRRSDGVWTTGVSGATETAFH